MPAHLEFPNALAPGSVLAEYRVQSVLGVGGFGITYLARDTLLDKDVAIKEFFPSSVVTRAGDGGVTLNTSRANDEYETGLDRFLLEARTLAGFSHPNIVRVNRYFKANGTGYMVMDYEKGEPLKSWLEARPFPSEEVIRHLLAPLLEGINKVHEAGFLHRDIKPDNIFVRRDNSPVLLDFGSARHAVAGNTRTLTTLVTPGYAPFEQYTANGAQGPWSDVYALGGVLFFAVIGRHPPDALTRMKGDTLATALAEARGRYSTAFLEAIEWAMRPEEKERPKTVAEWKAKVMGPGPVTGAPPAPADQRTVAATPIVQTRNTGPDLLVEAHAPPPQTLGGGDISNLLERRAELERIVREKFERNLTVMFTDLKGSTAIAEAAGDLAVRAMLKRYHDLVESSVKTNNGTLVKTIGDGTLCHFDEALPALRAAAAIQRGMDEMNLSKQFKTLLLARIGMHTGVCILEKNDIFGDVVNTASRFESSAHPGEIFISEDTYNALTDKAEFYCRFDRAVTLKGKSMPFNGYTVFWDPKEAERDKTRPRETVVVKKTPGWKIALWVTVPLAAILVFAIWITQGETFRGESKRSILHELPGTPPSK
jgi:serine/threonine protein kinase